MKTVKLSEESYNKLKDRLINEISYSTVDHDKFWKSDEGQENDIDDMDLNYL
jgi:hypothetical protein